MSFTCKKTSSNTWNFPMLNAWESMQDKDSQRMFPPWKKESSCKGKIMQ